MPEIDVRIYAEADGKCPLVDWLDALPPKVRDKAIVRVERLGLCGHELRRPEADYLRDDIYELRLRHMSVQYRILYFFAPGCAVLSHGLQKESEVPDAQIDLAGLRRNLFLKDPTGHTHSE